MEGKRIVVLEANLNKKKQEIKELSEKLDSSSGIIFSDYRGLNVSQITELRRRLKEFDSQIQIYKNTYLKHAFELSGLSIEPEITQGPTAIITVKDDPAGVAGILTKFIKETNKSVIKGGILEKAPIDKGKVEELACLPSKDVLIGKVVGSFKLPINQLVQNLTSPIRGFIYVLNSIKDKK